MGGGEFGGGQGARDESRDHAGLKLLVGLVPDYWVQMATISSFRLLSRENVGGGELEVLSLGTGGVGALRCLCLTQSKIHYLPTKQGTTHNSFT